MTKSKNLKKELPHSYKPGYLAQLDRRTELFQRLNGNFLSVVEDLGGASEIGHVKQALVERFVFLEAVLHKIEADLANNPDATQDLIGKWIQAVNSLTGLAKTLGIERRANNPWTAVDALPASNGPLNGSDHADE
jgi:hypothetical protein